MSVSLVDIKMILSIQLIYFPIQASRKWRENNLDLSRQKVSAQLSAMNAATAQLVTLTGTDEPDYGLVGASVNQM